jgi:hypothetical protein
MPDDDWRRWFRMCQPCSEVRHDACEGAAEWCECYVELLIEAEGLTDGDC